MKKFTTISFILGFLWAAQLAAQPIMKQQWEQLPDLNTARIGHQYIYSGDNPAVIGGHTVGFAREQSAEIFKDGEWVELPTPVYVHDDGGALSLSDGRTLIFGGHRGNLGTNGGETGVDVYDPATETFANFGNMNVGRAMCTGVEVGGKAFIVGDYWSAYRSLSTAPVEVIKDGTISLVEGQLLRPCTRPYLFPSSDGSKVLIAYHFADKSYAPSIPCSKVDKIDVSGDILTEPIDIALFDEWEPNHPTENGRQPQYAIGGGKYVILGVNKQDGNTKCAVLLVDADKEDASVLCELPETVEETAVEWNGGQIIVNQEKKEAYVVRLQETDETTSAYMATIDYVSGALKSISIADDLPAYQGNFSLSFLPDGRILVAGGSLGNNFNAVKTAYAFGTTGVKPVEPMDLNGDGSVNVGDVTTLVNIILGKAEYNPAADLNGDGDVNVGDVTTLVNHILGKDKPVSSDAAVEAGLCPDAHHPHLIDLGPAGKWACCNVGANAPWEYGGRYAWGETEEKETYTEGTYNVDIDMDIAGNQLYDVAAAKWGPQWQMPTASQNAILANHCTYTWMSLNETPGGVFTAPNGNSIFVPAAGYSFEKDVYYPVEYGYYWSSTPNPSDNILSFYLNVYSSGYDCDVNWNRYNGLSVRACAAAE